MFTLNVLGLSNLEGKKIMFFQYNLYQTQHFSFPLSLFFSYVCVFTFSLVEALGILVML